MLKNKTILSVFIIFFLTACSSIGGVFSKKDEAPLEGDRISVLELQKSLSPDKPLLDGQAIAVPEEWVNKAWPQAGGYPNHSMQNLSLQNANLERAWKADIGKGSTSDLPLTAQPVSAGGIIFTLDTKAMLSAFREDNGKRLWELDTAHLEEDEHVIGGGLSFAHGLLYVTNGYDELLAVAPEKREIIWRSRLPAPSRAAPTVIGGRVFVSTVDSRLVAVSAKDGSSIWEYTGIGETTSLLGAASPAANSEIVIPAFSSGEITALRVENGSVAWSDNLSNVRQYGGGLESLGDVKAMPVINQGIVVAISFSGKIAAIDERSGTRIWQKDISGSQTPWVAGSMIYIVSASNELLALSLVDGAIIWIKELNEYVDDDDKDEKIRWSAPIMGSNRLILTGSHGEMIEVDVQNGNLLRTTDINEDVRITPIISNETLYLLGENGSLMAYR